MLLRGRTAAAQLLRQTRFDLSADTSWRVVDILDLEMAELAARDADGQRHLRDAFGIVRADTEIARERPSMRQFLLRVNFAEAFFEVLALELLREPFLRVGLFLGIPQQLHLVALEPAAQVRRRPRRRQGMWRVPAAGSRRRPGWRVERKHMAVRRALQQGPRVLMNKHHHHCDAKRAVNY